MTARRIVRLELAAGTLPVVVVALLLLVTPPAMEPMFDDRVSWFGLPATIIVFGVAMLMMLIGWAWMRRIIDSIEPPDRAAWRRESQRSGRSGVDLAMVALGIAGLSLAGVLAWRLQAVRRLVADAADALIPAALILATVYLIVLVVRAFSRDD